MIRRSPVLWAVLPATIIAGLAGYLVTWLAYHVAGAAAYAAFAVFWAALYLAVGALSGIQQEVTRATRPIEPGVRTVASRSRNFALVAAVAVFMLMAIVGALCLPLVAGAQGWHLILPLAVGAASYVVVATLGGSLAGVAHWRSVALLVVTDGLLRLALTGLVVLLTHDVVALAWAAALPFPLAIALLWPVVRRRFVGTSDIDVGYRALTWNVLRTVLASLSTAILVSGFPLVLGVVWAGSDPKLLGQLIFAITLARAPLIVAVMSFQGVLIVRFRDGARPLRTLGVLLGSVAAATAAAAVFAWFLGEPVFELVAGPDFGIDRGFLTVLVISSGLIGALCVTGAATLAAGAHRWFTGGWLAAAAATIVFVVTGSNLLLATATAVLAGPLAGLVVHLVHLLAVAPKRKAPNVG